MRTSSPFRLLPSMWAMTASTATPALSLGSSVAAATASIKSFLLILASLLFAKDLDRAPGALRNFRLVRPGGDAETTPKGCARQAQTGRVCPHFLGKFNNALASKTPRSGRVQSTNPY